MRAIEKSAPTLTRSAPERIHYEWMTLLSQPGSFHAVKAMEEVGLFKCLFPEMDPLKGLSQDRYHHLDVFQHSLQTFRCLEELMRREIPLPEDLAAEISSYLKQDKKAACLKWAALFHDLGRASIGNEKDGYRTFYGHAEVSQKQFGLIAIRYRLSNQEKIFIERMIGWHMRPLYLVQEILNKTLTRRAVIRFARELEDELNGIFLLALADSLAAQGKEKPEDLEDRLVDLWRRTLSVRDEIIRPWERNPPLISGKDLIALGLTPAPYSKPSCPKSKTHNGKERSRTGKRPWNGLK